MFHALALAVGLGVAGAAGAAPQGGSASDAAAAGIVAAANRFRAEQGLGALSPESRLTAAAAAFAGYMARTDRYGHDADGRQPQDRVGAQGYDWCGVLENVAWVQSSAPLSTGALVQRFVDGWKESPGHRRNLLDPGVDETGVGVAQSERTGRWYAVQVFARPRSRATAFSVFNPTGHAVRYRTSQQAFELDPGMTRTHTQCVASGIVFDAIAGQGELRIEPKSGERWEVRDDAGGRWHLERAAAR